MAKFVLDYRPDLALAVAENDQLRHAVVGAAGMVRGLTHRLRVLVDANVYVSFRAVDGKPAGPFVSVELRLKGTGLRPREFEFNYRDLPGPCVYNPEADAIAEHGYALLMNELGNFPRPSRKHKPKTWRRLDALHAALQDAPSAIAA